MHEKLLSLLRTESQETAFRYLKTVRDTAIEHFNNHDSNSELCLRTDHAVEAMLKWSARNKILQSPHGLPALLSHVKSSVPFYRSYLANMKQIQLSDFPVVSRNIISQQYTSFLSDTLEPSENVFFKTTSGTTGMPLIVWFDLECFYNLNYQTYQKIALIHRNIIQQTATNQISVINITDNPTAWNAGTVMPSLRFSRLQRVAIGKDEEADAFAVSHLSRLQFQILSGNVSSLLRLSDVRSPNKAAQKIKPQMIFVSGEQLYEDHRSLLSQRFGCPVYNGYTSSEGGLIAHECIWHQGMHIANENAIAEVLLPDGAIGNTGTGEIIISNLWNWAMPFIRYRTGDYGTIETFKCKCGFDGQTITDFPAREAQFVDPLVHKKINEAISMLPVKDWQVIHYGTHTSINWIPLETTSEPVQVENEITAIMHNLDCGRNLQVQMVKEIVKPGKKISRFISAELPR